MKGRAALVAASHGTSHPDGQRAVAALVGAVAETAPQLIVSQAFVDVQQPDVRQTLSAVDQGRDAVVVPLLLSAGYHVRVDLARDARETRDRRVTIADALGPDRRLTELLARRLDEAGLLPDDLIVLAAAGSSDQRAVDDCRVVAADLAAVLGRPVTAGFISAAIPRLADAVAQARSGGPANARVVVACYLLAPGYFSGLAGDAGADLVSEPLLAADREVPRELVHVILERYRAACNADVSAVLQPASDPVTTW